MAQIASGAAIPIENATTLVLPGLFGSGEGHWQWYWARERPRATVVEQEDWQCPRLSAWRRRLAEALEQQESVFLVAHSLGTLLAADLGASPLARKIRGALLVAPCDLAAVERLHPCIVDFGGMPTRKLAFPSLVVASRNDPYMDFATARRLASAWGSALVDLGDAGHINIASGFGRWPAGYELFARLDGMAAEIPRAVTAA